MSVIECLTRGLLKQDVPDKRKARNSLATADRKLLFARRELDAEIFENSVVSSYTAMFHAARALLYKDGFKERSHYAVCEYVGEKYSAVLEKKFVHALDALRKERHVILYSIESELEVSEQEARDTLLLATEFVEAIKKIVE